MRDQSFRVYDLIKHETELFVESYENFGCFTCHPKIKSFVYANIIAMNCVYVFQKLKEFRDDELHHHDIGLEHDAEKVTKLCHVLRKPALYLWQGCHVSGKLKFFQGQGIVREFANCQGNLKLLVNVKVCKF